MPDDSTLTTHSRGPATCGVGASSNSNRPFPQDLAASTSREYFDLVRANTVAENQVLATQQADEELVIELRGRVYQIR